MKTETKTVEEIEEMSLEDAREFMFPKKSEAQERPLTNEQCRDHRFDPGAYGVCRRCGCEYKPEEKPLTNEEARTILKSAQIPHYSEESGHVYICNGIKTPFWSACVTMITRSELLAWIKGAA